MGSSPIPRFVECRKCSSQAVMSDPLYCNKHFLEHYERKVLRTIKKYKLISKNDSVVVAVSGGKDSTACLDILRKRFKVKALAIDEGIAGYRKKTLADLELYCKEKKIPLTVVSAKKELGITVDSLVRKGERPCSVCGAIRRYLLNKHARKLKTKKIATGHNLDDEAQSIMMNFLRNQLDVSSRLGPVSGIIRDERFIPRIKPLYFCSEKENTIYCHLQGFEIGFAECPYAADSFRAKVRDNLNDYESTHQGAKRNVVRTFLKILPDLRKGHTTGHPNACSVCGEPSKQALCKVCQILRKEKNNIS